MSTAQERDVERLAYLNGLPEYREAMSLQASPRLRVAVEQATRVPQVAAPKRFDCIWCEVPERLTNAEHRQGLHVRREMSEIERRERASHAATMLTGTAALISKEIKRPPVTIDSHDNNHESGASPAKSPTILIPGRDGQLRTEWLQRLTLVKETWRERWPLHWPSVEVCLAAIVTTLLKDVDQSLALFLIGESGTGKGTVLEPFLGAPRVIPMQKFSENSLATGYREEGMTAAQANAQSLYKMLAHRTLLTPDLGTALKSGGRDSRSGLYASIPGFLDGTGFSKGTGTYGVVGEMSMGGFPFVWLGGATMALFNKSFWRDIASLGPRLLLLRLPQLRDDERVDARDYSAFKHECGTATVGFLKWIFDAVQPRSLQWPRASEETLKGLRRHADLMARALATRNDIEGQVVWPMPSHLDQRMTTLVHGLALLWCRDEVGEAELKLARRIARSTGQAQHGFVLAAISEGVGEAREIASTTSLSYPYVETTLKSLEGVGVIRQKGSQPRSTPGRPRTIWELAPRLTDPEDAALRAELEDGAES